MALPVTAEATGARTGQQFLKGLRALEYNIADKAFPESLVEQFLHD